MYLSKSGSCCSTLPSLVPAVAYNSSEFGFYEKLFVPFVIGTFRHVSVYEFTDDFQHSLHSTTTDLILITFHMNKFDN